MNALLYALVVVIWGTTWIAIFLQQGPVAAPVSIFWRFAVASVTMLAILIGSAKAHYEGIKAFSETDQTEDLKSITLPVLVMQGDDDQVVPYKNAAILQDKLLPNSQLKIYPGFPHGMHTSHADTINADLLAFIRA